MVIKFSCTLPLFSLKKNMSLLKKKLFGSYHQRQVNEMHLYRLTFLTLLLKYKRKKPNYCRENGFVGRTESSLHKTPFDRNA